LAPSLKKAAAVPFVRFRFRIPPAHRLVLGFKGTLLSVAEVVLALAPFPRPAAWLDFSGEIFDLKQGGEAIELLGAGGNQRSSSWWRVLQQVLSCLPDKEGFWSFLAVASPHLPCRPRREIGRLMLFPEFPSALAA